MKQFITLMSLLFFSLSVYSQKDTTVIIKTDIYSNFDPPKRAYNYSGTIDFDSVLSGVSLKTGKIKMISFDYDETTKQADKLFKKKDFSGAVKLYILAFSKNNDLGQVIHRFNAGCCFAMLNKTDSSFYQLYRIAEKGGYYNQSEIQNEKCLNSLHTDSRWQPLLATIKANAKKIEDELNSKTPQNNQ
jgi:hypothetical protein